MASCGGEFPVAPTPVATSVVAVSGTRYQGTLTLGNGATTSFNMTLIARGLATRAVNPRIRATVSETSVSGSFSTGNGLTGTVQGSLTGSLENGVFQGSLAATSATQAEERNYSGPVTSTSAAWVPGTCVQNCTADGLSGAVQTVQVPTAGNPPVCSFGLASGSPSFGANGGNGNVAVTAASNCAWSAEALVPWITIVGNATAVGSGGVAFTVQANTGAARQGSLRVAGQTVTVSQTAGSPPLPGVPQITISPGIVGTPSTVFHVNGTGFTPGGQVRLGPAPFQITVTAAADGTATDQTFTNPNLFQFLPGTYEFVAIDLATARESNRVVVTVADPPTITVQPANQTITSGGTATMTVAATGTAPLSFQWYVGSSGTTTSPISGATASSYTTPVLTTTTTYWVRVTNAGGTANSNTAVVTVTPTGTLTGIVSRSTGGSISGATVQIVSGGSAVTNASGAYTITNVAVGSRTVNTSAPGFTSRSDTVAITGGATTTFSPSLVPVPQSNLVFTFTPNAEFFPTLTTSCSGGSQPFLSWFYNLRIDNNSAVPFTIETWTLTSPQGIKMENNAAVFQARFGTQTIQAKGSVNANLCTWFTVATSGSITYSFMGTNGNGPFTTPSLSLPPD